MNTEVCPTCGRGKPGPKMDKARYNRITRALARGLKHEEIAAAVGMSKQRVQQIAAQMRAKGDL